MWLLWIETTITENLLPFISSSILYITSTLTHRSIIQRTRIYGTLIIVLNPKISYCIAICRSWNIAVYGTNQSSSPLPLACPKISAILAILLYTAASRKPTSDPRCPQQNLAAKDMLDARKNTAIPSARFIVF